MSKTKIHFISKYKIKGIRNYGTIQECADYIKNLSVLGLDIETSVDPELKDKQTKVYQGGLDPYLSRIVVLQVGDTKNSFVIDVRDFTKEELKPILDVIHWNEDILIVGQNLKFEGKHLKHKYGIALKNVWDTMIVEMNLCNGIGYRYSLADLSKKYLNVQNVKDINLFNTIVENKVVSMDDNLTQKEYVVTPFELEDNFMIDKSTRLQFINIGDNPLTLTQVKYSSDDIVLPILIREKQLMGRRIHNGTIYNPTVLHRMENAFTQVIADIELNGMPFVKENWLKVYDEQLEIYNQRLKDLNSYIVHMFPEWTAQPNLFNPVADCSIEWTSSKQVISFFRKLENPENPEEVLCPKAYSKQTRKREWTVGAKELLKLLPQDYRGNYMYNKWIGFEKLEKGKYKIDHHRMVLAYLLLKKSEQNVTTFGKDWLKYVHPITGRVHCNYRQILNTGRMSSSNPNLQNLPNTKDYRGCFKTTEDNWIVNNDYSSQESRVLADKSGDTSMVNFFKVGDKFFGDDFHAFTATKVFKVKESNPDLVVPPKELPNGEKNPDFTEEDGDRRNYAKTVNFGLAYGKEAKGFADDFGTTEEEAEDFLMVYMNTFPALKEFFKRQRRSATENGMIFIDDVTDRRWFCPYFKELEELFDEISSHYPAGYMEGRSGMTKTEKEEFKKQLYEDYPHLPKMWKDYFRLYSSLERAGLNYPIQGTASSQIKTSLIYLRNHLIDHNVTDFKVINVIHDEILGECPKEVGEKYGKLLEECMVRGGNVFVKNKIMAADYVLSEVWGH